MRGWAKRAKSKHSHESRLAHIFHTVYLQKKKQKTADTRFIHTVFLAGAEYLQMCARAWQIFAYVKQTPTHFEVPLNRLPHFTADTLSYLRWHGGGWGRGVQSGNSWKHGRKHRTRQRKLRAEIPAGMSASCLEHGRYGGRHSSVGKINGRKQVEKKTHFLLSAWPCVRLLCHAHMCPVAQSSSSPPPAFHKRSFFHHRHTNTLQSGASVKPSI